MSIPRVDEEIGKIDFEGKTYGILSAPIDKKLYAKIYQIGLEYGFGFTVSGPSNVHYYFTVEEKKLHLKEIKYNHFCSYLQDKIDFKSDTNFIKQITGSEKIFASWANGIIKAVVSSKNIGGDINKIFDRDILMITVKKGIIIKCQKKHEVVHNIKRKLEKYIEE